MQTIVDTSSHFGEGLYSPDDAFLEDWQHGNYNHEYWMYRDLQNGFAMDTPPLVDDDRVYFIPARESYMAMDCEMVGTIEMEASPLSEDGMVVFIPARESYVAMDCEMVGTIVAGESAAARVVLVNWDGQVILDEYILPDVPITDYRTFVSGVTAEQLKKHGKPLHQVRTQVLNLIRNKVLVGHGLSNDLQSLWIDHPWYLQRDTACYTPLMQKQKQCETATITTDGSNHSKHNKKTHLLPRKLKNLVAEKLGRDIQSVGHAHSPIEDAVAALDLYKSLRLGWERSLCAPGSNKNSSTSNKRVKSKKAAGKAKKGSRKKKNVHKGVEHTS